MSWMGHSTGKPFALLHYCSGSEAAGRQSPALPLLAQKHPESQRRTGTLSRSRELDTGQGLKSKCSDPGACLSHCVWLTREPECSCGSFRGSSLAFRESPREVVNIAASYQRLPWGVGAVWRWFYVLIFQFASFSTVFLILHMCSSCLLFLCQWFTEVERLWLFFWGGFGIFLCVFLICLPTYLPVPPYISLICVQPFM